MGEAVEVDPIGEDGLELGFLDGEYRARTDEPLALDRPVDSGGWGLRTAAITDLVVAQGELVELSVERDRAMRARDAAMRAAREAGWTYDDIIARTGVSSTTIVNALRRP